MTTSSAKRTSRILWYQLFGLSMIIALSWMDELLNLPTRLFGGSLHSNWHESAMESLVAIVVWIPIFRSTKRILARMYYLEDFVRICGWCHKIGDGAKWISLEEFLSQGFAVRTSHGICEECARQNFPDQVSSS